MAAAPAAGSLSISNTDLTTPTVMKNGTPATAAAGISLYLGFSEGDKVQIVSSDIKANSYWKVAGTVYQASGAGVLSFTMPKTDLTIAKADQQVKYTLGKGVSLYRHCGYRCCHRICSRRNCGDHYCGPCKRHRRAGTMQRWYGLKSAAAGYYLSATRLLLLVRCVRPHRNAES